MGATIGGRYIRIIQKAFGFTLTCVFHNEELQSTLCYKIQGHVVFQMMPISWPHFLFRVCTTMQNARQSKGLEI